MGDYRLIGILVSKKRKNVLQLYQQHNNLPVKLYAFTPKDVLWKRRKIIGLYQNGTRWEESALPFPHAIYNCCYNKKNTTIRRLEDIIGQGKCFNRINWFNKWVVYSMLKQSDLRKYIPDTFLFDQVDLSELLKSYKLVFIKPTYGNKGKSVYRVELKENKEIYISLHSLAPRCIIRENQDIQQKLNKFIGKRYIVQQGIQSNKIENKYYDIRVLVQKNIHGKWTVSTISCRLANELYFNASVYQSIFDVEEIFDRLFPLKTKKIAILGSIDNISINVAQILEHHMCLLGELSVDFVLDKEMKLWIIEINGKPQKSIYNDIKNFKYEKLIYRRPVEYAYYLSKKTGSFE